MSDNTHICLCFKQNTGKENRQIYRLRKPDCFQEALQVCIDNPILPDQFYFCDEEGNIQTPSCHYNIRLLSSDECLVNNREDPFSQPRRTCLTELETGKWQYETYFPTVTRCHITLEES